MIKYVLLWWFGFMCFTMAAEFMPRFIPEELRRKCPWIVRITVSTILMVMGSSIYMALGRISA